MNWRYVVGGILLAFAGGFILGRWITQPRETEQVVTGKPRDGVVYTGGLTLGKGYVEFAGEIKNLPRYLWVSDTVYVDSIQYVHEKPDTAAIVRDYLIERRYDFEVFDNEYGMLTARPVVQFNRLQNFEYTHTPRQVVKTIIQENKFTPFVSASYGTLGYTGLGGGLFIKDLGVEYKYIYNVTTSDRGHEVGIKYKF